MKFEYDKAKSKTNKGKHGIDFDEAKALWNDDERIELPSKDTDECRVLVVALLDGKHWTAIITYRSETVRLISVRRSRKKEMELYEKDYQSH